MMMLMCLHLHCCPASCYALGHIMDIASVNHTHRTDEQEEATSKKSTGGRAAHLGGRPKKVNTV
eukprot:scaffold203_cov98-Skeletonema_dohrnii-CCMP3373.AAC.4